MTGGVQRGQPDFWKGAWGRWLPVAGATVAILLLAPFLGELRERVRESVGLGYLRWVSGALAAAGLAGLTAAVVRIRRFRVRRYGFLVAAGLLVALQVLVWGTGQEEVDVVERIHLLEYGVLAILFARAFRPYHDGPLLAVLAVLGVGLVGLADETVQWLTPVRVGDGRDVLLNLYSGLAGVLFALALQPPAGSAGRAGGRSVRVAAGLATVLVLAGAAFFDAAHLGHEIRDPRAGVFLSWHSPEELVRAAEERARSWSREGLPTRRPLAREDAYLSEAGWHAKARNDALDAGELRRAWRENRILERWYRPYLDVRGRWPADQRAAVEADLAATDPAALGASPAYRSPALEGRVVPAPPRALLWTVAFALAGGLAGFAVGWRPRRPVMFPEEEPT